MTEVEGLLHLSYTDFSESLHKNTVGQRIPIIGSLEVTQRCNLRCLHCYIPEIQRAKAINQELRLTEIHRILDEITDAGCLWFLLTGGDPFMRGDFLDIYTYARRKGLILTIFTNGTLINPKIANYLADWPPLLIEITLYGASRETYEQITGISGSYKRCINGIELLLEHKIHVHLKTMLMRINHHELGMMKSMAKDWGVPLRFDPIIQPALDGSIKPLHLRLSPEEVVNIEKNDPDRAARWPERFSEKIGFKQHGKSLFICGAGNNTFHIDPFGNLSSCLVARHPAYSLRQGNFREGWEKFIPQVISRQHSDSYVCALCDLRGVCPQCPSAAELEYDNPEKPIEYFCHLSQLRQKAFMKSE